MAVGFLMGRGYRREGMTYSQANTMPNKPIACDPRKKLLRLEQELNQIFLERADLIKIILLALLTRHHVLVFGKPGAAKSSLVRAISKAISGGCFSIQLGKDTSRDEVFGPIRVSELPNDRFCRAYENFLPGKPLVFLDEIDKSNSVILNALYTAMEERLFLDDGVMRPMPLVSLFGAANSITQLQSEALSPLLDRFLFRVEADWIQSDSNFLEFVRRRAEGDGPLVTTVLTLSELEFMQGEIHNVAFPGYTQESVAKLRKELANEGIFASDRRWGYIIDLLKAVAYFNGDSSVGEEHFALLRHVLWSDVKQGPVIERLLKALDQGLPVKVKAALTKATSQADAVLTIRDPNALPAKAALTLADLRVFKQELERLSRSRRVAQAIQVIEERIQRIEAHRQAVFN